MKTTWAFDIRAQADGASVDLSIYDIVGDPWGDAPTAKQVLDTLAANRGAKDINLRINSMGGVVFEGFAMYALLAEHPAKVHVSIDGIAASIASVIAMAGDDITMADNAMMMMHDPMGGALGQASDLRKMADVLDQIRNQIANVYAARSGKPVADVLAAMDAETWMTAEEALGNGYATRVVPAKKVAAQAGLTFDTSGFMRVPSAALALIETMTAPLAKAVQYHAYPKRDDDSWDGPAAVGRLRKWASSDGSGSKEKMDWAKYRNGFAWYDEKNAEDFAAYNLPHHDVVDGAIVTSRKGTIAAGNAVQGSRGGTSIPESELGAVKAHLAKHYKQFDMDPPWEEAGEKSPDKEPDNRHGVTSNIATPIRGAGTQSRKSPMTKEELKAQHPELYAAVVAEGVPEGVAKERKRVSAHIKLGTSSGDMKLAHDSILNGANPQDDEVFAAYQSAAMNRRDISARAADDKAPANPAAPAPNAAPGGGDAVDRGVEAFLSKRGKPAAA
jgi:ATP-dependent Clp endopeptidase proteolytic subunit ClpP